MVESVFVRAQWPEAVDSKAQAAAPRVSCPPEGRARLDRYDQRIVRQDIGLIGGILFVEQFGRDHGDDVGALPGGFELVGDVHRERNFGTGRDEHGLASPSGFAQTVSAFKTKVFRDVMTPRRAVLARGTGPR